MNQPALGTWSPARQRTAAAAVLVALLTAVASGLWRTTGASVYAGVAYVAVTSLAVFVPAWIPAQVIGGQLIAGTMLLAPDGPEPLWIAPLLAGVILTAELLAAVSRLDASFRYHSKQDLRGAALAAGTGAVVFAAVIAFGSLRGPTGLLSVAIASAACVVLALLLVTRVPSSR
jgi:hypothetical protein